MCVADDSSLHIVLISSLASRQDISSFPLSPLRRVIVVSIGPELDFADDEIAEPNRSEAGQWLWWAARPEEHCTGSGSK